MKVIVTTTSIDIHRYLAETPAQVTAAMISSFIALYEDDKIDRGHPLWSRAHDDLDEDSIMSIMMDHPDLWSVETYDADLTHDDGDIIDATMHIRGTMWRDAIRMLRGMRQDRQG